MERYHGILTIGVLGIWERMGWCKIPVNWKSTRIVLEVSNLSCTSYKSRNKRVGSLSNERVEATTAEDTSRLLYVKIERDWFTRSEISKGYTETMKESQTYSVNPLRIDSSIKGSFRRRCTGQH